MIITKARLAELCTLSGARRGKIAEGGRIVGKCESETNHTRGLGSGLKLLYYVCDCSAEFESGILCV